MPKLAIVIPTYNPTQDCYENIINYLNLKFDDFVIYVVNNNSTETEYIEKLKEHSSIQVQDSIFGGAFEAGALLQAYQKIDAENYLLIQDSIKLVRTEEINYYCKYVNNFVLAFSLLYPIGFQINDEIKQYILNFDYPFHYDFFELFGIQFCTFIAKKKLVSQLVESNILVEKNLPRSKMECEAWERIFGLGFFNNNILMKGFDIQATEEDAKNYAPYTKSHILNISLTKYTEKYHKKYLSRS